MSSTFFIFFKIIFGAGIGREPRNGNTEIGRPGAGTVRARLPARPLFSVPGREPCTENSEIGGPGAGTVRARLPAKPYSFVPGSKFFTQLPAGTRGSAGNRAGRFAPRSPLGLIPSFRGANSSHNFRPESAISPAARPAGLLPSPREALCLRFGEQILHTTFGRKVRFRQRLGRPVCSPLPARPYPFVSGSKFFTQLPAEKCGFAGVRTSRFAPLSPLGLIPSFRGANSSHNFRPESAISPAARSSGLLPVPR